jgi:L-alanine-DL-glutamate epimerase-like enolase superfamily enzyme
MKITRIETIPVQVPIHPQRAIRASRGTHSVSPFLLIKVHTNDGPVGLGEVSCTPRWSGEDQVTAAHYIATILEPLLQDQDPTHIERLTMLMRVALAGNPFTKAGLEMALWDLLGKIAGLPVYALLGGPVRDWVPTKFSVSGVAPAAAANLALWACEQGFTTLKVKVGIQPDDDVARTRAVRAAVGTEVRLGVDANGGWPAPRVAIPTIHRLVAEAGIFFAEQPVPPLDVAWLSEVRARIPIPVIADESLYSLQDGMALARAGAADVLSIYVGKSGGIGPARKIAALAEAAGLVCTVGSNLELGIGSAAMAHLALATSGIGAEEYPCDILTPFYYEDDIVAEPIAIEGGRARPNDRPGLGVDLDDAKVERYRVR